MRTGVLDCVVCHRLTADPHASTRSTCVTTALCAQIMRGTCCAQGGRPAACTRDTLWVLFLCNVFFPKHLAVKPASAFFPAVSCKLFSVGGPKLSRTLGSLRSRHQPRIFKVDAPKGPASLQFKEYVALFSICGERANLVRLYSTSKLHTHTCVIASKLLPCLRDFFRETLA